ncbi:hypothetical protein [Micromonospora trifolii]|uniref:hypothetical protein n=1 Tax=Micromonospora trifolii TaxID=2911208 RepID=UPI003CE702A1
MPDQFFADLYRDTEHLTWAPAEQVLERGRRRSRQTRVAAVLAGAVAVAVVATGVAALAGSQDGAPTPVLPATGVPTSTPTPTPTPSATPSLSPSPPTRTPAAPSSPPKTSGRPPTGSTNPAVPGAALLTASDLPPGYRKIGDDKDGDWSLHAYGSAVCSDRPNPPPKPRAERVVVFRKSAEQFFDERVRRYSTDSARATMDWARQMAGCEPFNDLRSMSITSSGFAGDEAILIRFEIEGSVFFDIFVRQGDLVAEISPRGLTDQAEALRVAQRAADRLCAGTDDC